MILTGTTLKFPTDVFSSSSCNLILVNFDPLGALFDLAKFEGLKKAFFDLGRAVERAQAFISLSLEYRMVVPMITLC